MGSAAERNIDETGERQLSNQNSLGESEEEYLRSTWGKLGVGQDGYLDQSQLALVCECIGMEKLSDDVISQLFDKLDLDHDGRISFGEFLHLFRNVRPGKGDVQMDPVSYDHNDWGIESTSRSAPMRSDILSPSQSTLILFANIDPTGTGLATYEATAEYLHSLGVNAASSLLEALSFSGTQKVNLRDLVAALHEEMNASLDAGILTNSGHSGVALHTGIVLMQQELSNIRLSGEHARRECEKLRSDLQEANQRASLLAQEVDENHTKQETMRRSQFKQLEQRHADQLRLVQEVAQTERDQLVSQLQRDLDQRQQQLFQIKEEETKLKQKVEHMTEENARLLADNANLTEQLSSTERANGRLIQQLDGVSLMAELESRCEALGESQRNSLTEQLNRMAAENLGLRDTNDELSAEVESLRGQLAVAVRPDHDGSLNGWRSEPTMSGAVKRRNGGGDEGDVTWIEDLATMGKMRKKDPYRPDQLTRSPEESPCRSYDQDADVKRNSGRGGQVIAQSLAAQLEDAKDMKDVHNDSHHVEDVQDDKGSREDESGTTIKGQLKRVFEKLRLQIVEEFLEGSDGVADLKQQYHAILLQQEDRHLDDKRRLVESYLLKLSALEVQLIESHNRCEDLVQLQTVMEAEHTMHVEDLRNQLERLNTKNAQQEEYENLTDALADLDAVLEKESTSQQQDNSAKEEADDDGHGPGDVETSQKKVNDNVSLVDVDKVEQLEQQCKTLESELDQVKVQVVKIVLENEELRVQVQQLEDDRATASKSWAETIEEKVQFETALLQQRIKELNHSNDSNVAEKNAIDEDRRDLESRLELLRTEFDRLDDYWQMKIDTERELNEEERQSTLFTYDEKFKALEMKIKEYEELLLSQGDGESTTSSLSTIEERANWEKQLNDLEEESQLHLSQIAHLETQLEDIQAQHTKDIERLKQEKLKSQEDVDAMKLLLTEAVEREEKLMTNIRSPLPGARPLSPSPKSILPSGYCPLKSKGWAKTQRSSNGQHQLSTSAKGQRSNSPPNGDPSKCQPGSSCEDNHPKGHQLNISLFHSLNARIKQQELRCRETCYALQMQKKRTEQILLDSKNQHEEEIKSLELMMKASQETMLQMSLKQQNTLDKLASSDKLIMQLYSENSQLLQALQLQSLAS